MMIVSIASSKTEKIGKADGKSVVATTTGDADRAFDSVVWGMHGLVSRPSKKTKGLRIRIGPLSIIIASYTYGIEPPEQEGAVKLYSTDAEGAEQATIRLDSSGNIKLNGDSKRLVTWDELNTALTTLAATLTAHVHAANGTPSPGLVGLAVDISSAKTTTIKTGG